MIFLEAAVLFEINLINICDYVKMLLANKTKILSYSERRYLLFMICIMMRSIFRKQDNICLSNLDTLLICSRYIQNRDISVLENIPHIFTAGKCSPPPPPPDVAQNDLMLRLGLLLGERGPNNEQDQLTPICQAGNQTEETFTSVSSLGSSEATPDRGISDTSPLSTLTGKI